MHTKPALDELFERRITYPDCAPQERLARLVGLDDHKSRLTKILGLLVNSAGLEAWIHKHHAGADALLNTVLRRPPLVVHAVCLKSTSRVRAKDAGSMARLFGSWEDYCTNIRSLLERRLAHISPFDERLYRYVELSISHLPRDPELSLNCLPERDWKRRISMK